MTGKNEFKKKHAVYDLHKSLFVKIKIELLSQAKVFLFNFDTDAANGGLCAVIQPTIIENELHVRHKILNALILVLLELLLDEREAHGIFDDGIVVWDVQSDRINRVGEDVGSLVLEQSGEHALGSFLPLIVDWGTFGNFGDLKLIQVGLFFLFLLIGLEVLGDLWILPPKILKFSVSHGRVETAFTEESQHVSSGDFALIFARLGLRLRNGGL